MPRIIKDGVVSNDTWLPLEPERDNPTPGHICSLDQWQQLASKADTAVQLEPGQDPSVLFPFIGQISLIVINFPVFTDGRGFSYAIGLRENGYQGELRAGGHFIRDQLTYLRRCGFNAFQFADDSSLESAIASLTDFSEFYQASVDQPLPLFRRRTSAKD